MRLGKIDCAKYNCPLKKLVTVSSQPETVGAKTITYTASNVMKNSNVNMWNKLVFNTYDMMSGIINKYPKFGQKMMSLTEKMLVKQKEFTDYIV